MVFNIPAFICLGFFFNFTIHKLKWKCSGVVAILLIIKTKRYCHPEADDQVSGLKHYITLALMKRQKANVFSHSNTYSNLQSQISYTAQGKELFFFYITIAQMSESICMRCALFTDSSIKGMLLSN